HQCLEPKNVVPPRPGVLPFLNVSLWYNWREQWAASFDSLSVYGLEFAPGATKFRRTMLKQSLVKTICASLAVEFRRPTSAYPASINRRLVENGYNISLRRAQDPCSS